MDCTGPYKSIHGKKPSKSFANNALPFCDGLDQAHLILVHASGVTSDNVIKTAAMCTQVCLSPAGHLQFAD